MKGPSQRQDQIRPLVGRGRATNRPTEQPPTFKLIKHKTTKSQNRKIAKSQENHKIKENQRKIKIKIKIKIKEKSNQRKSQNRSC